MSELTELVMQIAGVETNVSSNGKTFYKLKNGEGHIFQLWQTKQDGSESVAYQEFKKLDNQGIGQVVKITYKVQTGEYKGKPVSYKTIATLKTAPSQKVVSPQPTPKTDPREDETVIGRIRHGFAVEAYAKGKPLIQETVDEINDWIDYVITGKLRELELLEGNERPTEDIPF